MSAITLIIAAMIMACLLELTCIQRIFVNGVISRKNDNYEQAVQFLMDNNKLQVYYGRKDRFSDWNFETEMTEQNKENMVRVKMEVLDFNSATRRNASRFAFEQFKERNSTVYRWFNMLVNTKKNSLPKRKYKKLQRIIADMQDTYANAKVCKINSPRNRQCDLSLDPDLTEIMSQSRNYHELLYYWRGWRAATGKNRSKFLQYVELMNEAARLDKYKDAGELWRSGFNMDNFEEEIERLLKEIEPFYKQLHAYVRRKLIKFYSDKYISPTGPIPAHLLGNMWVQTMSSIFDIVKPYPNKTYMDISKKFQERNMRPIDLFKMSENFFVSIGLSKMPPAFWKKSILEKVKNKEMSCAPNAWNFFDVEDFRIKMCTTMNKDNFILVHHEMGHVEYYQQFNHLPKVFQRGANQGFHEAIGDTMALSATTPTHLKKVGLFDTVEDDYETTINNLMEEALRKIPFLPYAYVMDLYRWKVFRGDIKKSELNKEWWTLKQKYQGICSPVRRNEREFDAASKYHTVGDSPFIHYFVSHIIQFQFHHALCEEAGHRGPLHQCDIYQSKKAGKMFREGLSLGSLYPWQHTMKVITGGRYNNMTTSAILKYFEPLIKWLEVQNKNEKIGWHGTRSGTCRRK